MTWSPDVTFTTAARGPSDFRFTMVGDEATSDASSLPIAQVIAALRPRFNVVVGDLSYAGDGSGYYTNGVPTGDFIVVGFHNCVFSSNTTHGSDGGIRTVWQSLFDRYQVDLVVSGHVHAYERSYPIRGSDVTKVVPSGGTVHPETDGTTYIDAGGGGQGLYTGWYGTAGGGDPATASGPPLVWEWTGTDTAAGGTAPPLTSRTRSPATPPTATRTGASSCSTSPLRGSPAGRPASWSGPSTPPRPAAGSPAPPARRCWTASGWCAAASASARPGSAAGGDSENSAAAGTPVCRRGRASGLR